MGKRSTRRKGGRPVDNKPTVSADLEEIGEIVNAAEHHLQREEDEELASLFDAFREYGLEMIHPNHHYSRQTIVRYIRFSREKLSRIVSLLPGHEDADYLITVLEQLTAIVQRINATITPVSPPSRRSRTRTRSRSRSRSRTPQL